MTARADPACMVCGSTQFDADDWEVRHITREPPERYVHVLWTYCRACDCWTEHEDEPATADDYRGACVTGRGGTD